MADVSFILREDIDWNDSLVLVSFPGAGAAGTIAGHYLRRHLNLPLLGSIHLEGQSPAVTVEGGVTTSPLRIHGGQVECKLGDESCPSVYLIMTDLALQPAAMQAVAAAILAETAGARMVLCLDAVTREAGDDTPDVHCASPDPALVDLLQTDAVRPVSEGIVVGMSGQILLGAEAAGVPGAALLVEAAADLPDGRAAAALVKAVDKILPSVDIDDEPLLAEAMELEQKVAAASKQAERASAPRSSHTFI